MIKATKKMWPGYRSEGKYRRESWASVGLPNAIMPDWQRGTVMSRIFVMWSFRHEIYQLNKDDQSAGAVLEVVLCLYPLYPRGDSLRGH